MIRRTLFAVSSDEARAILTGVLMDFEGTTLRFVATDTHRLAMRTASVADASGAQQAIVPARAMTELLRNLADEAGDVTVKLSDSQVLFETPSGIRMISRLIDGQFPNYQRVVPATHNKTLTLQAQPFTGAVRRAAIVARNAAYRVVLRTTDGKLTITAESSLEGNAYEEVEVIREGDDIAIAFNAKFMLDALAVLEEEGLRLELTETLKPGILRPIYGTENTLGDYLCVLMPMQLT
jgi:DNA polymerase III subunit beta